MADAVSSVTAGHEGLLPSNERPLTSRFRNSLKSVGCTIHKESRDIESNLTDEQLQSQGSCFRSLLTRTLLFFHALLFRNSKPGEEDFGTQYSKWTKDFVSEDFKKYPEGWPQLAAFLDSCDSFSMYRRFGTSHSRLLVNYEVEITSIEQRLRELDQSDVESFGDNSTSYRLETRTRKQQSDSLKIELMAQLESKLRVYDDLLLRQHHLKLLPQSSKSDHANIAKWIWLEKPLVEGQYDFIYRHRDFVSLGRPSHSRFEDAVKNLLNLLLGSWFKNYIGVKSLNDPNDGSVEYYSGKRVTLLARLCIVFLTVFILYVPVLLFLLVSLNHVNMAIIVLTFATTFSIILSLLSEASVLDIFIGSATYCAVLVTFLGNLQGA